MSAETGILHKVSVLTELPCVESRKTGTGSQDFSWRTWTDLPQWKHWQMFLAENNSVQTRFLAEETQLHNLLFVSVISLWFILHANRPLTFRFCCGIMLTRQQRPANIAESRSQTQDPASFLPDVEINPPLRLAGDGREWKPEATTPNVNALRDTAGKHVYFPKNVWNTKQLEMPNHTNTWDHQTAAMMGNIQKTRNHKRNTTKSLRIHQNSPL